MIEGNDTGTRFSLFEHTIAPGVLGAPPHTDHDEDGWMGRQFTLVSALFHSSSTLPPETRLMMIPLTTAPHY